ncbi:glycerophosphodiester phosphodiesterase [Jeotgalibaca caeni]|uniref:glycerophosphodiester phosphodiesterase n=1 Tax=Jeotgalibaca caeni TaxID=3028623 RepID=UPI00308449DB
MVAHRGSKGTAPENTIAAFKEALRVGSDGIELDVHLSKDGIPVVIHDESINRTTNGKGYVKDLTVAELQQYDAGSWFHTRFSGEKIPTLEEVMEVLIEHDFEGMLNIELKTDQIPYLGIERIVLDLVRSYQPRFTTIYSSFNYETMERLTKLDRRAEFALLFSEKGKNLTKLPSGRVVKAWHPRHTLLPYLLSTKSVTIPIRVWTVNRRLHMAYCFVNKVDTIITDFPEKALKVRKLLQREK